jgi:hypothetical protein
LNFEAQNRKQAGAKPKFDGVAEIPHQRQTAHPIRAWGFNPRICAREKSGALKARLIDEALRTNDVLPDGTHFQRFECFSLLEFLGLKPQAGTGTRPWR